ncbi:MAG: hypothetical protein ACK5RL_09190 [Acidimicrobiales bacterium]
MILSNATRLFIAIGAVSWAGTVAYGYLSGGTGVGPLSFGLSGAVGDQFGFAILAAVTLVALALALIAFMAAIGPVVGVPSTTWAGPAPDPRPAPAPAPTVSLLPAVGAVGVALVTVGVALDPVILIIGLMVVFGTTGTWTVTNRERAERNQVDDVHGPAAASGEPRPEPVQAVAGGRSDPGQGLVLGARERAILGGFGFVAALAGAVLVAAGLYNDAPDGTQLVLGTLFIVGANWCRSYLERHQPPDRSVTAGG